MFRRYLPAGKYGRVRLNEHGIEFMGHDGKRSAWPCSSVVRIEAFKHDLFGYDEITLAVVDTAGGTLLISEEDDGYEALLQQLPGLFPGIRTDWYSVVVQPPFAENRTVLWKNTP